MVVGILTEKNSAARNFATALGGDSQAMSGTYQGTDYVIVAASGHLYGFKEPHEMVPADKQERYSSWELSQLPWDPADFSWERAPKQGAGARLKGIEASLSAVDEIVMASDIDPTGEGQLLAWEIIDELNLHHKPITRMAFTDEAPASLQKAFVARTPLPPMDQDGEYLKADYRTKFDLLSMQSTRSATKVSRAHGRNAMLRNGRLKSAMVVLVGDQLKAHNDYKKVPFYQAKFTDDHDVVYTDPEAVLHEKEDQVPIGDYHASDVVHDSTKDGRTAPPKLLDLSGLSTILAKRGMKSQEVLSVYQKMYEAQIVSYPRTEDKVITPEQFKELEPKIDQIAAVVGIDPAVLTHRTPRTTHVKTGGAHGANRPGPNVPGSLAALEKSYGRIGAAIYEVLAKNYLTMLGEDYLYKTHKGHVKDFPAFTGSITEPVDQGWKGIFDVEAARAGDEDEEGQENAGKHVTLGTRAEPFVHEGFPPRPQHPNMNWLMKQLEKRNVGTGATRTSTFADVTAAKSAGNKYPLMAEKRGKITLQPAGELNYLLLPGTTIGDLALTERVYENMDLISKGELSTEQALSDVADWVARDIEIMEANAKGIDDTVAKDLAAAPGKEKFTGVLTATGETKSFNRSWGGYRLSDEECTRLLDGETVEARPEPKYGKARILSFTLGDNTFTGEDGKQVTYFGIQGSSRLDAAASPDYAEGVFAPDGTRKTFKRVKSGYRLSDAEVAEVLAGKSVQVQGQTEYGPFAGELRLAEQTFTNDKGETVSFFGLTGVNTAVYATGFWVVEKQEIKFKRTWGGHEFTEAEIADLLAGKQIEFAAVSKNGKDYVAKGSLTRGVYNGVSYVGFSLPPRENAGAKGTKAKGSAPRARGSRARS